MPELDLNYPQHVRTEKWADAAIEVNSKGVFDDSSPIWNAAPDTALELSDVIGTSAKGSGRQVVLGVLDNAVKDYERLHGMKPSGGVLDSAINEALRLVSAQKRQDIGISTKAIFDSISGTTSGSPIISDAVEIALYSSVVDSIPFAGVIPMERGLKGQVILGHNVAASTTGGYKDGEDMTGANAGKAFMSAHRVVTATASGANYTAKITYADGDTDAVPILSHSANVYINGFIAGSVSSDNGKDSARDTAQLQGDINLPDGAGGFKEYTISGTVTPTTGVIAFSITPALPAGTTVEAGAMINFEHDQLKGKRPRVNISALSKTVHAQYSSGILQVTQEAFSQFTKELGIDPLAEGLSALRTQFAAERHMKALRTMYRIGKNYITNTNLNMSTRLNARDLDDIWQDFAFTLSAADTAMRKRTGSIGIGLLYVGDTGRSILSILPPETFQAASVPSALGTYRLGRLFGSYDVYYTPNLLTETTTSLEMLAIGRSSQTGFNPYIVGDALGLNFEGIATDVDLKKGAGCFSAGVSTINPHQKPASAAAIIAVTGLIQ